MVVSCPWLSGCQPLGAYQCLSVVWPMKVDGADSVSPLGRMSPLRKSGYSRKRQPFSYRYLSDREARSATFGLKSFIHPVLDGGENRYEQRHERQLVHWIFEEVHGRCLDREFFPEIRCGMSAVSPARLLFGWR